MKKISILILLLISILSTSLSGNVRAETQLAAPTLLGPGDIAIIGFNTSTTDDIVTILFLKDVAKDTVISFTDVGWDATKTPPHFSTSTDTLEGVVQWTATRNYAIGESVQITLFTLANLLDGKSTHCMINSLTDGDQIFIFQGTLSSPTLIYGANLSWTTWQNTSVPSTATSGQPTQLAGYSFAVNNFNAKYSGTTNFTSVAAAQAAIANPQNWQGINSNQTITFPTFSIVPTAIKLSKFTSENKGANLALEAAFGLLIGAALIVFLRRAPHKKPIIAEEIPNQE
jgi:hypothetical protein